MLQTTPEVIQVEDPFAEILYTGKAIGNLDGRRWFKPAGRVEESDSKLAHTSRLDLFGRLKPAAHVIMRAQGGPHITELDEISDPAPIYGTDGFITTRPGLAMLVTPADCPVIIMSADGVLASIHAGRAGADQDIHLDALERVTGSEGYGVAKEDLNIHISPSIGKASYYYPEIKPEQLFDPRWEGFLEARSDGWHIDLVGRIVRDLVRAGIDRQQLDISSIDVGADLNFFSHVRSGRTPEPEGRNGVVAMLRGTPEAMYD